MSVHSGYGTDPETPPNTQNNDVYRHHKLNMSINRYLNTQ